MTTTRLAGGGAGTTPLHPSRNAATMDTDHDATKGHPITPGSESQPAMSVRAVLWVTELRGISLSERGILLKVANHANQHGDGSYASVATIAAWAGVTPRNVNLILAKLLRSGLVEVTGANGRKGGGRRSTTYRVVIPADFDLKKPASSRARGEANFSQTWY